MASVQTIYKPSTGILALYPPLFEAGLWLLFHKLAFLGKKMVLVDLPKKDQTEEKTT
jgi:hypothetical protein